MNKREALAISAGLLALALGVIILLLLDWHLSKSKHDLDGVAFIAVLIIPFLVYVLVSGRLLEFSAPGGWGAKFQSHAQATVEVTGIRDDMQPLQALEKGRRQQLSQLVAELDPDFPNALILKVGRGSRYALGAIQQYLQALVAVGAPSYVIFVNGRTNRFIGSASAGQVMTFLEDQRSADEFMRKLSGEPRAFTGMGFLVTETLAPDDTNMTALQKFFRTHADALVVTSQDARKPIGVVNRDHLLTKLMLELAS